MSKNVFFIVAVLVCSAFQLCGNGLISKKLSFTENKGQITDQYGQDRPDIQFKVESPGLVIFVSNTGLHYQWNEAKQTNKNLSETHHLDMPELQVNSYRMEVKLLGADPHATVIKEQQQAEVERYYTTHVDAANNLVHAYHKVTYKNVYPNIDWVLYIEEGHVAASTLKYDFVVHPGGKVSDIKLQFNGASELAIKEDGSLQAITPMGEIREKAPYSYMTAATLGAGAEVTSHFQLNDNILSFKTDAHEGTLIIDPELEWATYYGGGYWDIGTCALVDSQGNVYMTGAVTSTTNIATVGAYQTSWTYGGVFAADGFIAKFSPTGVRIWATYYGGNGADIAYGAALDVAGNIYLSGQTGSSDVMASPGSFQSTIGGMNDAFVVKFDSSGQRVWGTYYGGPGNDQGGFIATDTACNIYMVGYTKSTTGIATSGSFKTALDGTAEDAFLVKFDSSGQRQWGTYFGGPAADYANSVACDASGSIYISGYTKSTSGIATSNSHQSSHSGGANDLYLAKFSASGTQEWATYYGGPGDDYASSVSSMTTDAADNVYLAGRTTSETGIATAGSQQSTFGGDLDACLVKFNAAGEQQWGTYYGGSAQEVPGNMVVDAQGNIFWTGLTKSVDNIASPGSIQPAFGGGANADAFLVKLNQDGQRLWGSYFGGTATDEGIGTTVDKFGNIYLTGSTGGDFPVTEDSHQDTIFAMVSNAYLVKLCGAALAPGSIINGHDSLCASVIEVYSIAATEEENISYIWTLPDGWSGSSDSSSITILSGNTGGTLSVQIVKCSDTSHIITKEVGVFNPLEAIITIDVFTLKTLYTHESYQWFLNDVPIPGATDSTYTVQENGDYTVVTTDVNGCVDTSATYSVTNYTGINDQHTLGPQVTIYPNPTQNMLYINSPEPVSITLSSIEGRALIYSEAAKEVSLEALSEGIYLLRITDKNGLLIKTEKVIKQ